MRLNSILILAALLPCANAQPGISIPVLGYAYDPGLRGIRAIRGTPGAALLADTLDPGFDICLAAVAPSQDFALAIATGEGDVQIVSWRNGAPSSAFLPDAMKHPDRFVFSNSGRAALLSASESGRIQLVTSLPDSPVVQEVQPAGRPAAAVIAVGDDGSVAFAAADGVHLIGPSYNQVSLPFPPDIAALAFSTSSADLLAVTSGGDLYLARNIVNGADVRRIYSDSRAADPISVRFSADGSTGFAASKTGIVAAVDLNTGTAYTLSCQCAPTVLEPLGRSGLFRLTDISSGPVLLFDGTPNRSRFWFVPAPDQRSAQ